MGAPGVVYHVDASYFVFRAYHALAGGFADADGNPTHAVYGFARFLADLLERERPAHVVVAFDESLGVEVSYRNSIFPAYKANREDPPPDLARQFGLCREFCRHVGVAEFASARYEADDLIGTFVARARSAGLRNVLLTRDKDLAQLIRDGDLFWDGGGRDRYRYEEIGARFGAPPERFADFLALTGDAVDNVPGVPGIGRKTASRLFEEFRSLEDLYANLDRVARLGLRGTERILRTLAAHREDAFLARRLTAIRCDLPIDATLEDLRPRAPDRSAVSAFLERQGFGTGLGRQVERIALRAQADCA
ncbi:MAG: flap endonuclease [Gammaproteobacteria bacterium]|nr:flap endonuclease [Gammaproteobacteria bacterium]